MATAEQTATFAQAIETLTNQVARLTEENVRIKGALEVVNANTTNVPGGPYGSIIPKDYRPKVFDGQKYPAWADEVRAYLGYKKPAMLEALKKFENKANGESSIEEASIQAEVSEKDIHELYIFLMTITDGEARDIVKVAPGNGMEA